MRTETKEWIRNLAGSDNVTDDLSEIDYTKEEQELKIKQEEERHEMQ